MATKGIKGLNPTQLGAHNGFIVVHWCWL